MRLGMGAVEVAIFGRPVGDGAVKGDLQSVPFFKDIRPFTGDIRILGKDPLQGVTELIGQDANSRHDPARVPLAEDIGQDGEIAILQVLIPLIAGPEGQRLHRY